MRGIFAALAQLRLWQKVNGAIFLTFALIAVTYIGIEVPYEQHKLNRTILDTSVLLKTLVERDQDPLANEIFERRVRAIELRLKQIRRVDGILEVNVYGAAGELLGSDGPQKIRENISDNEPEFISDGTWISREKWHGHHVLRYFKEIKVVGERIGSIEIYYSLAEIEKDQRLSIFMVVGLLASILLIMAVLLNLILFRTIIRPITSLSVAMGYVQAGELGHQVETSGRDEIGDLSKAFNQMSSGLKQTEVELKLAIRHLEEANTLLEERVRERTAELEKLAMIDALTGLANRRYFEARAAIELAEARRNNLCLTVLALDIDHFKNINDNYGHAAGDIVLQRVGEVLTNIVRPGDLVSRIGGEEFTVLLPGLQRDASIAVAERIRTGIENLIITVGPDAITVTISIGVATLTTGDPEIGAVHVRADEALYLAKRRGRNCVIAAC